MLITTESEQGKAWKGASQYLTKPLYLQPSFVGTSRPQTDCYDQALQLDPQFIPALLNRSLAALQTGEPSRESSDAVTCNWRCKTV